MSNTSYIGKVGGVQIADSSNNASPAISHQETQGEEE